MVSEPVLKPSQVVYAGRLKERMPAWRRLASPFICDWIEKGVPIEFEKEPEAHVRASSIQGKQERAFARSQVTELYARGCIFENPHATVVCPLGVVPKKGAVPFRLIHNVRFVNRFCIPKPFKYEKLTDLQNLLVGGEWMCKLDLSAGYHHVPLRAAQAPLFGFEFEGKTYSWRQLFFGLSPAPYIFTMILRDVAKKWRFDGINLIHYIDDIAIFAKSCLLCAQQFARVRKDLEDLGFVINMEKSVLEPTQEIEFLGYEVNTRDIPTFKVPAARAAKLVETLVALRDQGGGEVPVRLVASAAGQILSMSLALAPARLYTRGMYHVINTTHRHDMPGGWNARVQLSTTARAEVEFWLSGLQRWNGCAILRSAGVRIIDIVSDASHLHGWGGWAAAPVVVTRQALETGTVRTFDAQGRWSVLEREEHINLQELRAFLYTAQALKQVLPRGARIRPRLDNMTAVTYLNNGGGRVPLLTEVVKRVWLLVIEQGWVLETAVHIRGVDNVRADRLSRVFASCDWKLHPRVFAELDVLWGPHTHDRCASRLNRQNNLPFDSLYYEPGAAGVDTFTQEWVGNNWVNGDFSQLSQLLAWCREQRACATFIAPRWPRPWWRELCDECVDWRVLPRRHDLFLPGNHSNARGVGCPNWETYAFRLDYRQEHAAERRRRAALPWQERRT